jgi:hypothetical protein
MLTIVLRFLPLLSEIAEAKPVLDPKNWQSYKLIEKKQISENTAQYRFRLPNENAILGLPIGQHISVQAEINGKQVMRSYTPVSSDDDRGFFDLLIKVGVLRGSFRAALSKESLYAHMPLLPCLYRPILKEISRSTSAS